MVGAAAPPSSVSAQAWLARRWLPGLGLGLRLSQVQVNHHHHHYYLLFLYDAEPLSPPLSVLITVAIAAQSRDAKQPTSQASTTLSGDPPNQPDLTSPRAIAVGRVSVCLPESRRRRVLALCRVDSRGLVCLSSGRIASHRIASCSPRPLPYTLSASVRLEHALPVILPSGWLAVRCAVREGIALSVLEDREKRTRAASTHKTTPRTGPARKSLEESLLSQPISLRPWFPRCRRGPDKRWFYTGQGWRQRLCASHRSLLATATSIPLEPQPRRR